MSTATKPPVKTRKKKAEKAIPASVLKERLSKVSRNGAEPFEDEYTTFLKAKVKMAERFGFDVELDEINPRLKDHQKASVQWAVSGGRRALFEAFGLGKSVMQLEIVRLILTKVTGRGLIVCPLGVRHEFVRDAIELLGWETPPKFIRHIDDCAATGIYLTNYETIRDGKLDPCNFIVASLDEASILRGFGGTKTFREFMRLFTGDGGPSGIHRTDGKTVKYRFVATATPSPNEYIELLAYSEFLGIMDVGGAKTRFFKRDSTKADKLTIHPHKEPEFWLWMASWALFVQKPSDLGYSDEGYEMPEMIVNWHEVMTDHHNAGYDRRGQAKMFRDAAIGIQDSSSEKRVSLERRIAKMLEIHAEDPAAHRVIWHDLEIERAAIHKAIPECVTVQGKDTDEHKETSIIGFSNGEIQLIGGKPCMLGSGVNWQRHCHRATYLGIGFKFNDFIQSLHRIRRFLQTKQVVIDIIYTEAERGIRKALETKWKQHNHMVAKMSEIIQEFGLSRAAMAQSLCRKMGTERIVIKGDGYELINSDCVRALDTVKSNHARLLKEGNPHGLTREEDVIPDNSIGLILTSIPFSTQYEYSPNFADFGHSEGNDEFFKQMDFLVPNLLRVLMPGRIAAIHVKDRIIPGGMNGLGFQTVYPFHLSTILNFTKHGFGYMGMKTIVTDVVRENNQTYRLGWTEQCKDGSKMGVGMPEYLLYFRKPPSDTSNSYADIPVVKEKFAYTRSRWQIDAHAFARSSGNRLLSPEEIRDLPHEAIYNIFKSYNLAEVYDFEHHVAIGEALEEKRKLPVTFMLLQPQSWHDDVWADVTRMMTLNAIQSRKGQEMHLCPMQFDIADRVITQMSNPGEKVLDPFGGLMTVPYRAIKLKRYGIGIELSASYFCDGAAYCKSMADELAVPTLFDVDSPDIARGRRDATHIQPKTPPTNGASADERDLQRNESIDLLA